MDSRPHDAQTSQGQPGHTPEPGGSAAPRADSSWLGRQLGGDLPCIRCGYNLRGLSIRGVCPECGAPVRGAILSVVDPQADVLQPINRPRLVAVSVVLWLSAALGAALVCWAPHIADLVALAVGKGSGAGAGTLPPLRHALVVCLALSGIGALGLIRPHGRIPMLHRIAAGLAVVLYVPLGLLLFRMVALRDLGGSLPLLTWWQPDRRGTRDVVAALVIVAVILLLQRPVARLLVARSLLMRSGRVDRQTMLAMALAAAMIAAGQVIGRVAFIASGEPGTPGMVVGLIFMVMGAALLTIGLFGSVADSVRIARAIVTPRRTVRQVVRGGVGGRGSTSVGGAGPDRALDRSAPGGA